jgi:surface polysaccharide O-acyltransferase-like enzyme
MDIAEKWIYEMDTLRGIAILAVIAIHTFGYSTPIGTINGLQIANSVIATFSGFAVPLFVFISGYVLSLNYHHQVTANYYSKRIRAVIVPYIIFSIFYLLYELYGVYAGIIQGGFPSSLIIVFSLLTGRYGYLWFLLMILQLYLLYPLLKIDKDNRGILIAALVAQLIWTLIGGTLIRQFILFLFGHSIGSFIGDMLTRLIFLSSIFYFVLGIYMQRRSINLRSIYLVLIPILTVFLSYSLIRPISEWGLHYNITNIVNITSLLHIMAGTILYTLTIITFYNIAISSRLPNVLGSLGKYSFGIYLIHYFFLESIVFLLRKIGITPTEWMFYPILFVGTVAFSIGAIRLIWRLPFSSVIFGPRVRQVKSE